MNWRQEKEEGGGREIDYGDKKQIENTMIGLGERADDADEAGGRAVRAAGRMDGRMDKGKRDAKEFGKETHPLCASRTNEPRQSIGSRL